MSCCLEQQPVWTFHGRFMDVSDARFCPGCFSKDVVLAKARAARFV
tara:strand:+ start:118 stop:255 length:138 start_codon:yes stop_codon:yes gene_type:complete